MTKLFKQLTVFILATVLLVTPFSYTNASGGYKTPHTIIFSGFSSANGNFIPLGQAMLDAASSTEVQRQVEMFRDGTWSGLSVYVRTANASGNTTLTIRQNGSDTGVTVTIPQNTTGLFQDLTNSVSVSTGDLMSIGVTTTAGTIALVSITALFESDNGDTVQHFVSVAGGNFVSSDRFIRPVTQTMPNNITVEADAATKILHDSTIVGIQVYVSANSRTNTATFRTRVNGATGISRSFTTGTTGNLSNTGSQSMVAGDTFNTGTSLSSGTGSITPSLISLCVVSDNPREITLLGSNPLARNNSTSNLWAYVGGSIVFSSTAENITRLYPVTPGVLSKMTFRVSANTATASLNYVMRVNGADANQTITYTSGTGWFEDASNSDTVGSSDYVGIRTARTASGTGSTTFQHNAFLYTMDAIETFIPIINIF